jgi:hypothetical protein
MRVNYIAGLELSGRDSHLYQVSKTPHLLCSKRGSSAKTDRNSRAGRTGLRERVGCDRVRPFWTSRPPSTHSFMDSRWTLITF